MAKKKTVARRKTPAQSQPVVQAHEWPHDSPSETGRKLVELGTLLQNANSTFGEIASAAFLCGLQLRFQFRRPVA